MKTFEKNGCRRFESWNNLIWFINNLIFSGCYYLQKSCKQNLSITCIIAVLLFSDLTCMSKCPYYIFLYIYRSKVSNDFSAESFDQWQLHIEVCIIIFTITPFIGIGPMPRWFDPKPFVSKRGTHLSKNLYWQAQILYVILKLS